MLPSSSCLHPPLCSSSFSPPPSLTKPSLYSSSHNHHPHVCRHRLCLLITTNLYRHGSLVAGATASDGVGNDANFPLQNIEGSDSTMCSGAAYLGLFVEMLGLDNDPLDREQAIATLWKYSQGGRKCIDEIMQFRGCINLVINLLKLDSPSSCEAAAGLLHTVTSVKLYRDIVAEGGAIEEISSILCQSAITPEIKEKCLCTLWNLSIDEDRRLKIAMSDLLAKLVRFLGDDQEIKVKEAVGGIIANLALSPCNHQIIVEAGLIPKLADLLKRDDEGYGIIRKEAKNALLELCGDDYYRILIIEEGLVRVPIVGSAAYNAFKPETYTWPSLPDGTEIARTSRPSRYGASELLIGLSVSEKDREPEEAKINAMIGLSHQQFLVRVGAIEMDDGEICHSGSSKHDRYTLLPWIDGIARLVLILGLEDVSAISRAAASIADASVNEHMRISFKEAGAVRHLVPLLRHGNETVRDAAAHALDKLSLSSEVCEIIETEGALQLLIDILKDQTASTSLLEKPISLLYRIVNRGSSLKAMCAGLNEYEDTANVATSNTQGATDGGLKRTPPSSMKREGMSRELVVDLDAISHLTKILKEGSPSQQKKVASILEHLAAFEPHATAMTGARIGSVLETIFETGAIHGIGGDFEDVSDLTAADMEEIGQAISATARLLTKLLNSDLFFRSINPETFLILLRRILKSSIPLHSKDWVAASLIKLETLIGPAQNRAFENVDMEVTIYDTIPRLVERLMTSLSYEAKRDAVIELNKIISGGVMDYTRALATAGGIFPLVRMIEEGSGDGLEATLTVLYNLSMDPGNHPAIIAAGAVPLLKRIVLSEGPHWARALRLLRTLPT